MSYDLVSIDKKRTMSVGAFSWPIILQETGMGYVLGYGAGVRPATYVYQNNPKNQGSPCSNDGYKVSSKEAKMMAAVLRGFITVQRFNIKEWEQIEKAEQERMENLIMDGRKIYNTPWAKTRIDQLETIADFIEKSGGFRIN